MSHELSLMMGRLLERSEATLDWLERIDSRLGEGDTRMGQMTERIAALETRKPSEVMPALEKAVKILLPYLIGGAVLAFTGSLDNALKVLTALGAK